MKKDTDILLVNPHQYGIFPFGIGILAAILKKANIKVSILNVDPEKPLHTAVVQIEKINPKIVGFTGFLQDFNFLSGLSKITREKLPYCKQLAGGWWSSPIPQIVFEETEIDYISRGEPDRIIARLCKSIIEEKPLRDFPGVCYREEGNRYRITDPTYPYSKSIDDLPLPAYELLDMDSYLWTTNKSIPPYGIIFKDHPRYRPFKDKKFLRWGSMFTGRGCYGKCTFCTIGNTLRRNGSPQYVVDHMELMQRDYNVDVFQFTESLSLSHRDWVKEFCNEILSRKMKCLYVVYSRGDFNYDDETFRLLSKSGCHTVRFGFESGDNGMLKSMKKKITVERYYEFIKLLHAHQIHVSGSFILNMPGETEKSLENTLTFIKKARLYNYDFGFATPYPDSGLYEYAKEHGFIKNEKEYILRELCEPRIMNAKMDVRYLEKYLLQNNFNNLSAVQLNDAKKALVRWQIKNKFHYSFRVFSYSLNIIPPLMDAVLGWIFLKKVVRFIFSDVSTFPERFTKRLRSA